MAAIVLNRPHTGQRATSAGQRVGVCGMDAVPFSFEARSLPAKRSPSSITSRTSAAFDARARRPSPRSCRERSSGLLPLPPEPSASRSCAAQTCGTLSFARAERKPGGAIARRESIDHVRVVDSVPARKPSWQLIWLPVCQPVCRCRRRGVGPADEFPRPARSSVRYGSPPGDHDDRLKP